MLVLIVPVHIKNRHGAYPADYYLAYEGTTVIIEDTAIPAAIVPIINILNEIVGNAAPDDVIPPLPNFWIIFAD